jgi:hypothetical protein
VLVRQTQLPPQLSLSIDPSLLDLLRAQGPLRGGPPEKRKNRGTVPDFATGFFEILASETLKKAS